jgi:23S rRNA pseudouridine2604 synthase
VYGKAMQTRLNKFISETGFCSRREADNLIGLGKVTVNGVKAQVGTKVTSSDEVKIGGQLIRIKAKPIYIALNKPVGVTCTTDRKDKDNIVDFLKHPKRIFPIGRLDKASEGLIFLTNDGDIVNKILRAGNQHEKEYLVNVDKAVTPAFVKKMASGVAILDTVTKKCRVEQTGTHQFKIILVQGLNRQIRRMCEALGYEVKRLVRTRIMNITLKGIAPGKWRYLSDDEQEVLTHLLEGSSKTSESPRS